MIKRSGCVQRVRGRLDVNNVWAGKYLSAGMEEYDAYK